MRTNFHGVIGEIDSLPGSSQVAVSHSVYLHESQRGNGVGQKAMESRLSYLTNDLGYDYVICTVREKNEAQIILLEKNGWEYLDCFNSRKTGNTVFIYGRELG